MCEKTFVVGIFIFHSFTSRKNSSSFSLFSGKSPTLNSPCKCHYSGSLIDGTEFDSSYKRGDPLTLAPNQVIKGWTEAMQLMKEGDKWELYIPSELGYGDRGAGGVIPGQGELDFIFFSTVLSTVFVLESQHKANSSHVFGLLFPRYSHYDLAALVFTMELIEVLGEAK